MLLVSCVTFSGFVCVGRVCELFNSAWVFRVGLLGFACFGLLFVGVCCVPTWWFLSMLPVCVVWLWCLWLWIYL